MWTIEAFRAESDGLVWDVDLAGVSRARMEEHLKLQTLDIPGSLPLTVDQVRSLLTELLCVDPSAYLTDPHCLDFFLAEYDENV